MRVVLAVSDAKNAAVIAAAALSYGLSSSDEIAVITVLSSADGHVWSLLPGPILTEIEQEMEEDARIALREAGLFLRSEMHSAHVHEFRLFGDLADQLNEFLINWKADLLIIGFSQKVPWRNHAEKIVTTSPCPVLVAGRNSDHEVEQEPKKKWWHEPSYII
jgi:nucleotide-binding universal stress UspA family protein